MQENRKEFDNTEHTLVIEGRNAVLEAFRSGKPIDKVFVLDGCQDGPVLSVFTCGNAPDHLQHRAPEARP